MNIFAFFWVDYGTITLNSYDIAHKLIFVFSVIICYIHVNGESWGGTHVQIFLQTCNLSVYPIPTFSRSQADDDQVQGEQHP